MQPPIFGAVPVRRAQTSAASLSIKVRKACKVTGSRGCSKREGTWKAAPPQTKAAADVVQVARSAAIADVDVLPMGDTWERPFYPSEDQSWLAIAELMARRLWNVGRSNSRWFTERVRRLRGFALGS
jgi:hypothetical protein